jgi:hypothetical protein
MESTERTGLSRLHAVLRLDPCIAYWVGSSTTVPSQMIIKGDVYCAGGLTNNGAIDGDVFAVTTISGASITGRANASASCPVPWPYLLASYFGPTNYYIGLTSYTSQQITDANIPATALNPNQLNPVGVCYCPASVNMSGGVIISGTLVVNGDLTVSGPNNVIAAVDGYHFPALVVEGQVLMKDGGSLKVEGLAQIKKPIASDPNATSARIDVTGALFVGSGGVSSKVSVTVTAAPEIASTETWFADGTSKKWGPAAGAFFKSVERPK